MWIVLAHICGYTWPILMTSGKTLVLVLILAVQQNTLLEGFKHFFPIILGTERTGIKVAGPQVLWRTPCGYRLPTPPFCFLKTEEKFHVQSSSKQLTPHGQALTS